MNTGFLGPAVATVLTVYGIETWFIRRSLLIRITTLQQYLPFTVLKRRIGTIVKIRPMLQQYLPFTVLKQYKSFLVKLGLFSCNSTYRLRYWNSYAFLYKILIYSWVATVLTVYGIETLDWIQTQIEQMLRCNSTYRLRYWNMPSKEKAFILPSIILLQQYLPFTVLKLSLFNNGKQPSHIMVATVLTVYDIWWRYSQIVSHCFCARKT